MMSTWRDPTDGNLVSNSSFSIQNNKYESWSIVFHKHRITIWLDYDELLGLLQAMSSVKTEVEIKEALESLKDYYL